MTLLKLVNVSKEYEMDEVKVKALQNINLEIKEKEFVAIEGPSGSGKSTLLHIIGALDRPTSGKLYINKKDVSEFSDDELTRFRGKNIGFVFQFFNLYPTLTALENVELPMIILEKNKEERRKRALDLLKMVGLEKRAFHFPSQLSGGERQRVAIARALANDPLIILADEPTGNLDSKSGEEIMKIFMELHQKGKTIVIVTHDERVAFCAERRIRIIDGKIISDEKKKVYKEKKI